MLFNISALINRHTITNNQQHLVNKTNLRENCNWIDFDYQVGQQVYVIKDGIFCKLDGPKYGPFPITDIFTNGTVGIQRGSVSKRINIR